MSSVRYHVYNAKHAPSRNQLRRQIDILTWSLNWPQGSLEIHPSGFENTSEIRGNGVVVLSHLLYCEEILSWVLFC